VREFFTHADENPHGWGLADFSTREPALIRTAQSALESERAQQLLDKPLALSNALVHIRNATVGPVEDDNCHPFMALDTSGRRWTLIHKGTVFDYSPLNPYFSIQVGSTDSERILLYLIDRLNLAITQKGAPLEGEERFALFAHVCRDISPGACLNLIVFDSDEFFIHTNYKDAIRVLAGKGIALFCTSALQAAAHMLPEQKWMDVPLCTAFSYKGGVRIRSGRPHSYEYFDNEEDTRFLYQDYAGL
jgi:glutamine amidotransferase